MWKGLPDRNLSDKRIDMVIKFDTDTIHLITFFENITGAPVRDCITDEEGNYIYFIIEEGKIGIAIGKNGNNVRNVEKMTGKNIKLFEFSNDLSIFIKNLIPQINQIKVRSEGDRVVVEGRVEKKDKAIVIGRDGKNIKLFKKILQRNNNVDELVVR